MTLTEDLDAVLDVNQALLDFLESKASQEKETGQSLAMTSAKKTASTKVFRRLRGTHRMILNNGATPATSGAGLEK